jgi:hypothetical protein
LFKIITKKCKKLVTEMVFISKLAFDQRFLNKKTGHLDRSVIILFLLIVKNSVYLAIRNKYSP